MSFFQRLFNRSLRKARSAEADGDLAAAIRLYDEAGKPAHVVRLQVIRAQQSTDEWARIEILRVAASHIPGESDDEHQSTYRECRLALARSLVEWVEAAGVLDRRDKALMEEAAKLFELEGELEDAGDAYARIGFSNKAADAYTRVGSVDKLDFVYAEEELSGDASRQRVRHVDDYRFAETHGLYLDAIDALNAALAAEPGNAQVRELHRRFEERLPSRAQVRLTCAGRTLVLIGESPLSIGRDEHAALTLLTPGLSRLHAQLVHRGDEVWIEDMGSRHGTSVNGVRVEPSAALTGAGEIALGDRCILRYQRRPHATLLRPQGRTTDVVYVWGNAWQSDASDESPLPPGWNFTLERDYWHVQTAAEIDGESFSHPVVLRLGARLLDPNADAVVEVSD